MAGVAWFKNPVLDESAPIVDGHKVPESFGVSHAKRHPRYVHSVNRNAHLMHRVAAVRMYWYAYLGHTGKMGRLKQPAMVAECVCGMHFALTPDRARTCAVPKPDSILCGRCHGEPSTFGKNGRGTREGWDKKAARVKLGCEVAGYPTSLERT